MKGKIQLVEKLNKIYTILFSVFLATIPFTEHFQAVPNILLGILIFIFPWIITKSAWMKLNKTVFYSLFALSGFILIGIILNDRWTDFNFLLRILLALSIGLLALPIKNNKMPLYAFVAGAFALLLASCVQLIYHFLLFHSLKLDVGGDVNRLLMGERPFLGFIYLISFCLSVYLAKNAKNKALTWFWYSVAVVFSGFILFIAARLSMVSLLIILSVSIFYANNKKRAFGISFGGIFILGLIMFSNPNFINRLTAGFEQENLELQKILVLEPRSHIWKCASDIGINETVPLFGFGFRNTVDKLVDCYTYHDNFINENHRQYFIDSRFNTHNQFLNFYLSSGVFSFLIFILFFLFLFKAYRKDYTTFALVLALFLFCILENVLSRQFGAMLFGMVISLVHFIYNRPSLDN